MKNIHVKIPSTIQGDQRIFLKSALASCAFEGQDNPKVQQKVVDYIASGRQMEDIISEIVEQTKKDPSAYLKQFK
ncbi:MAG: hypothetical protein LBH40_05895 [Alphaproteobacteria bacterium]|jgi:hypothetical protein|nr:hypothetical protein [Alphaproteobacteria bacterium]